VKAVKSAFHSGLIDEDLLWEFEGQLLTVVVETKSRWRYGVGF